MANLQVRNVPESVHESLRRHARESNCTISFIVLTAVERELELREWQKSLACHSQTDLGISAADILAEERERRDAELA